MARMKIYHEVLSEKLRLGETESTSWNNIRKFPDEAKMNLDHEVVSESSQTRLKRTYIMNY